MKVLNGRGQTKGVWFDIGLLRLVCDTAALRENRVAPGVHFKVCMLRENSRPVNQENETVSFLISF